jgi:multiple sugar transport system permease protein
MAGERVAAGPGVATAAPATATAAAAAPVAAPATAAASTATRTPATIRPAARRGLLRSRPGMSWLGLAVAAVLVVYYAVIFVVPFGMAIWLSMQNWDFILDPISVGLANYQSAMADPYFWMALRVTATFSLAIVTVGLVLQLGLAVLIGALPSRPQRLFLVIYYLPVVVPTVVAVILWRWLYLPAGGPLNELLARVGLPEQPFLNSPDQALGAVVVMVVWTYIGTGTVLFVAGIHNIPRELFEAAELDGAGMWQRFRSVTLPLLTPVIFYQVVVSVIATVQMFEQLYLVQAPSFSTRTLSVYTYELGFRTLNLGYGAAVSVLIFLLLLVVTVVQLRSYRVSWEY